MRLEVGQQSLEGLTGFGRVGVPFLFARMPLGGDGGEGEDGVHRWNHP